MFPSCNLSPSTSRPTHRGQGLPSLCVQIRPYLDFPEFSLKLGPRHLLGLVVLKLNVQTVLNPNLHLDGGVQLWVRAERVNHNVHLSDYIVEAAADGGSKKIPGEHGCVMMGHPLPPDVT